MNDGLLGYNLFAYCGNNFINSCDPQGQDAIWLQDLDLVYPFGHTGLLLQDKDGVWWHFYWGNNRDGKKGKKGNGNILMLYVGALNIESINSFYYKYYGNTYERMIYLNGDFSKSVDYAKKLSNNTYNLIFNNCMQVSADVLRRGNFTYNNSEYKSLLFKIRSNPIPNIAFEKMITFTNIVSRWNTSPWYLKWLFYSPRKAGIML